jgi:nucleoside-diphosphate-sugar epimerase
MTLPKKYLVTGGTGFIGSAIVRRLVSEGKIVRVLDNDSRGHKNRLDDIRNELEFISADIRDSEAVIAATEGIDCVFHLAFVNGTEFFYKNPELVLDVGVRGIVNILDACKIHNVKEFILASSSEVYQTPPVVPTDENVRLIVPDPMNSRYSYGGGKIISEIMSINYGRHLFDRMMIFRPHNVYGPDMGWEHVIPQFVLRMNQANKEQPKGTINFPIQGTGKETRSFVYIEDFIEGIMTIVKNGKHMGIYNIGHDEEISIEEVARLVGKYFKRNVSIIPSTAPIGGTSRRCPNINKLCAMGYKTLYSLSEGLPLLASWYVDHLSMAEGNQ